MALLYRDADAAPTPQAYAVPRAACQQPWLAGTADASQASAAITWGPVPWRTTFRAAAAPEALLLRFDCRDDAPWHTKVGRDDPLWEEEVVEIFLDPTASGRDYAEIEVNPANVVCDLRIRAAMPTLEGDIDWNFEGLLTHVRPWQNDEAGCAGWTVLAALPWTGFMSLAPGRMPALPPAAGDRWRFNVFRIKRPHGPAEPERDAIYAAWSVPDGATFHVPSAFREMVFL